MTSPWIECGEIVAKLREVHHCQFGRGRDAETQVGEAREGRKLGNVMSWQLGNDNVSRRA